MALGALTHSFPGQRHAVAVKTSCSETVPVKRSFFLTLIPATACPLPLGQASLPCGHHLNGAIMLVMDEACLDSYTAEPLDDT